MKLAIAIAALAALVGTAAKVDVATVKRNPTAEAFRATVSPNQPVGPARMRVMPDGGVQLIMRHPDLQVLRTAILSPEEAAMLTRHPASA